MRMTVQRTSDVFGQDTKTVEIESLEALLEFVARAKHSVIISIDEYDKGGEPKYSLEIYDNWRE